jgi:hypothetical protein
MPEVPAIQALAVHRVANRHRLSLEDICPDSHNGSRGEGEVSGTAGTLC